MDIQPPRLRDDPDTGKTGVWIPLGLLWKLGYDLITLIVAGVIAGVIVYLLTASA